MNNTKERATQDHKLESRQLWILDANLKNCLMDFSRSLIVARENKIQLKQAI